MQHELNPETVLSVDYVGSGSRRTDMGWRYNTAVTQGPGEPSARYPFPYITPTNWDRSWGGPTTTPSGIHGTALVQGPAVHGGVYMVEVDRPWRVGLLRYRRRPVHSGPYHFNNDRSVSDYDLTHNFISSWVYQLPFGRGSLLSTHNRVADLILGDWQFNGVAALHSGIPFHITAPGDIANRQPRYMRANLVGDPTVDNPAPARWIDTAAFASPAAFTFGNLGRNTLRSDWNRTFDLSLFREFPIAERARVQIRAEAYNAFNTPIFRAPEKDISSVNFGKVLAAADPRILQFSIKVTF